MTKIDDLERLHALLKQGALTQAEYDAAKTKLLDGATPSSSVVGGVCARLGQTTPLSSGVWRILFLAPMALSFFADLLSSSLGLSRPLTDKVANALFGGPIILYGLLYLIGVNVTPPKADKDAR
jgi:hypothetical protein